MPTKYVVDAHALVWFLENNPRLGVNAKGVLLDPASELVLPVIALAEACWTVEVGRSSIPSPADLIASVDADPRIVIEPLDRATVERTLTVTTVAEMHDRQIVAVALLRIDRGETVAILTRDANIRASGLVPVVW